MNLPAHETNERWRIFVAAWPGEEFLDSLSPIDRWLARFGSHRIIARDQRHLTLAFVGDVESSQIDQMENSIAAVVSSTQPLNVRATEIMGLPSQRSPKIVAVALAATPEVSRLRQLTLEAVAAVCPVETVLRDLDREPVPHITVARTRRADSARRLDFTKAPEASGVMRIGAVAIVRSTLTPRGPEYETVRRIELRNNPHERE